MKTGWIEKFESGRVEATLKIEFRMLEGAEAKRLVTLDSYGQTTANHIPQLSAHSSLYRAIGKDIFYSRLVLLAQNPLSKGDKLEGVLYLSQYQRPLRLLAEVGEVETAVEMGRQLFHGKLSVLSVHKADVERLAQSLIQSQSA
jgi:hypothetical protein